jgi:hemoglobin
MDGTDRATPYEQLGGAAPLRRIVERFYDAMDADPRAADIRAMHASNLAPMKEKLFEFLSGWLGGPPLYFQRPDAKCMGSAHAEFAIGERERDQWMLCMREALAAEPMPDELRALLDGALTRMADFMRNR